MLEIVNRFVAIDTEYHANKQGKIDKVYCICAQNASGKTFKYWTSEYKGDILKSLSEAFEVNNPIFVCHAFDKAERRALKFLGTDCSQYEFICTYHLAKMLQNTFAKAKRDETHEVYDDDMDAIENATVKREKKSNSLSYVALCSKYNLSLIDTAHKQAMRQLCIDDNTEGNEEVIMDYCLSDTQFLIPLLRNMLNEYYMRLKNAFCPLSPKQFNNLQPEECVGYLTKQMSFVNEMGDIADKGIPLHTTRCKVVKQNATLMKEKIKGDMDRKYPGSYRKGKDGLYHQNKAICLTHLNNDIKRLKIKNYPRSEKTGSYTLSSKYLKQYFKGTDTFGEDYRQANKLMTAMNKVTKVKDNPIEGIDECNDERYNLWYESLEPYGTITSRCTPKGKFIFGWHKSMYGLMNPYKGKWLVELDYSSEETFIQACICDDDTYHKIYQSKDIYLAFAALMGYVPKDEFKSLSTHELKEKYGSIRKKIKTLILGLSYGMGIRKLAESLHVSEDEAIVMYEKVNKIIEKSTKYKSQLQNVPDKIKAFSLPDGFICSLSKVNNVTTMLNWPFQSGGGMILRNLVHQLKGIPTANVLATIHDAVFFEVSEGDMETINKVSALMRQVANETLHETTYSIKVGEPDIIKYEDIWTPEYAFNDQFEEMMNFSQK